MSDLALIAALDEAIEAYGIDTPPAARLFAEALFRAGMKYEKGCLSDAISNAASDASFVDSPVKLELLVSKLLDLADHA